MHQLEIGGKELYQIAFYIKHLKFSTEYAILPYENTQNYEVKVPKQDISIKVIHIPIDEYLDILYSKKSQNDIKKEMSSKLKKLIPLQNSV